MSLRWSGFQRKSSLTDHGPVALRQAALDILEHGIRAADPYPRILSLVARDGRWLQVGKLLYDLSEWNRIFVVGAGKATQAVAGALEEVLTEHLTSGIVTLKRGESHHLERIRIIEASHPVPDQDSLEGAKEIARVVQQAGRRDLVFVAITGGSSALISWPIGDITLKDKQAITLLLLGCGASIREINDIRKHISRIKGGRLGQMIFPAELINLTVSDVIGDPLDYITDPTVPDTSTYEDAWRTMDKFGLWEKAPASIRCYLQRGAEIETPKTYNQRYHSFIAVESDAACQGSAQRCRELGFETRILTTSMEGESCKAAAAFVREAIAIARSSPTGKRYAFLASGETTVTLGEVFGEGGRNQEFALSAAFQIAGSQDVVVASLATDGTDGPTDCCGGLIDGETIERARARRGIDPAEGLCLHSAKPVLAAAGDLLISGPTGTNVNDVALLLIET